MDSVRREAHAAPHARSAWAAGVVPLLEAFGQDGERLIRAVTFAHYAPFPVPILITGRQGAGKTTVIAALADLMGQLKEPRIRQLSLNSIKLAAELGRPLIIDDAAPASSKARPNMLVQISGEVYSYRTSPLHDVSLLAASGDHAIPAYIRPRIIHVRLSTRPLLRALRPVSDEGAAAARLLIHSHLQDHVPFLELDEDAKWAVSLATNPDLAHERRRGAALYVGDLILRQLGLIPDAGDPALWLEDGERITRAIRAAVRYMRANGGVLAGSARSDADWVIGRVDGDQLMLFPNESLRFIRAEYGDMTLTTNAITRALAKQYMVQTTRAQGGTVPVRVNGSLSRAWLLPASILD